MTSRKIWRHKAAAHGSARQSGHTANWQKQQYLAEDSSTRQKSERPDPPPPYQDVLDFAYYSGWRRNKILYLTWDDVDRTGGVIRLSPQRSKTKTGRLLPISAPLSLVLERRAQRRHPEDRRVFRRDGVTVRAWRHALRHACRRAGVPHRLLHDCRRTAARNLVRAGVPERVPMLQKGHKTRAVFDRATNGRRFALRMSRFGTPNLTAPSPHALTASFKAH